MFDPILTPTETPPAEQPDLFPAVTPPRTLLSAAWLGQSLFYLTTGLWPLLHKRSFQAVTGPKIDWWLVKTVGLLVAVIGAALGLAWLRRDPDDPRPETTLLAAGSAVGLAAIDIGYAGLHRRIRPVYLLDAIAELTLAAIWLLPQQAPGTHHPMPQGEAAGL
jgi:hypothetical protein